MLVADFIVLDLMDAFVFFISGNYPASESASVLKESFMVIYGNNYRDDIKEFFSQFPKLALIKDNFAE